MTDTFTKGFGDNALEDLVKEAKERKLPIDIELSWHKDLKGSHNSLKLNSDVLEKSLDPREGGVLPPHLGNEEWKKFIGKNATYLGRFQVPNQYVSYDGTKVQPRVKILDHDHRLDLKVSFNSQGYKLNAPCPIATTTQDLNRFTVRGLSGFHRYSVFTDKDKGNNAVYQGSYFYDIYEFKTPLHEVIARNITNHHNDPKKSQTKADLKKEVINAIEAKIIENNPQAIDEFVNVIASDKPAYWRNDIAKAGYEAAKVTPSFRSYSTKGDNKFTLAYAIENEHNLVKMGVDNRSDEELLAQGYILFAAHRGDAVGAWSKGIYRAGQLGLPIWILGYAANLENDLEEFRSDWIEEFVDYKEKVIAFDQNLFHNDDKEISDIIKELNEDKFQIRLAGFMPQHSQVDPKSGGAPTERGIVDVFGKTIDFNPIGEDMSDCLTLTQP